MKIEIITIDERFFEKRPCKIANEICTLVYPKSIGCEWNKDNLIFRSSLWNSDGVLISASFKKFFNWNEAPTTVDHPSDNEKIEFLTKIDGSLLAVSKYSGEVIARTRGTSNADTLKNGSEIAYFKMKYPEVFNFDDDTSAYTRIFEWTTPTNKIILDYGTEPELWYIGKIYHDRYKYASQDELDNECEKLGVKRPSRYDFDNIINMIESVQAFKGIEGVCVYFNKGQDIRKVKGLDYLAKHRFKSQASFDNTLDVFFQFGKPQYKEFEKNLIETFDYECYEMVRGYASQICDAYKQADKILDGMRNFIDKLDKQETRKYKAMKIQEAYGKTNRCAFAFSLLDGKDVTNDTYKKLIYQAVGK